MFIPGILITILTFPGVMVHELGHKLFCEYTKVKVHAVCYFRLKNPCGFVMHEAPEKFHQTFLIIVGPLVINTLFSLVIFYFCFLSGGFFSETFMGKFLLWLGISIGMHAFPSDGDAKVLLKESKRHMKNNKLAIIGYPFAYLFELTSVLSIIWFDLLYAMLLAVLVGQSFII